MEKMSSRNLLTLHGLQKTVNTHFPTSNNIISAYFVWSFQRVEFRLVAVFVLETETVDIFFEKVRDQVEDEIEQENIDTEENANDSKVDALVLHLVVERWAEVDFIDHIWYFQISRV